jgi:NAD(P)H dehydrogenase (quinone)
MILVTGASGQLGHAILTHLNTTGVQAIGGTRDPKTGPNAHTGLTETGPGTGSGTGSGSDYRRVDFDEPDTLDFTDVETLVIVSAGTAEDDIVIALDLHEPHNCR